MPKLMKCVNIVLVLLMLSVFLAPAWAFELSVDPVKDSYRSGESITVTAGVYAGSGGFNWSLTDWESNTTRLDGDRGSITFNLPENNTGATATAVIEAVYGGERGSLNVPVEPSASPAAAPLAATDETGPLQIVDLYPANGATDVSVNTAVYIRFNRPAHIEKAMPVFGGHIGIAGLFYLLQPNEDQTVWSLPAGSAVLEYKKTYSIMSFMKITDAETGTVLYNFPSPPFPAWSFTTAEQEVITPFSITITDYPKRLQVGQSYPLKAVVRNKKGNVLDWPVDWEVVTTSGGRATVTDGSLTGVEPGGLRLVARAHDFPDVSDDSKYRNYVEIRQNFDRRLLEVWATELTGRENASKAAPAVGEDGTIYLTTGSGKNMVVRAYDSSGRIKSGFQEITGTGDPVPAKIGGREYLLAARDKKMCAFDPVTGRLEWQSETLDYDLGKASVDLDGNIYAGCQEDGKVYAFNLESDRYLWSRYVQYRNLDEAYRDKDSPVTVGPGNLIYVAGGDNRVFCLDSRGELQWQYATPTLGRGIPAGVEVDSAGNAYFLENASYYEGYDLIGEYNIYSLDAGGGLRWCVHKQHSLVVDLFVDVDDSLYVTVNDQVAGAEKLTRLNRENGEVENEFDVYDCDRFIRSGDGYIYTNKFIFNDNLEAVGYADDYYRNLSYLHYSPLALCPDGALARVVISEGNAVALEKVTLVDTTGAAPASIELGESEVTLIQGDTRSIFAQIKDGRGYILPYQALTYQSSDTNIATVDEAGKITAVGAGDTEITVRVRDHEEVTATLILHVLAPGEVTDIYFVPQHTTTNEIDLEERITSVAGVVGEEKVVQLVVRDQRGEVIQGLPVKWTLSDSSVVQMYNYSGGVMGSVTKGTAVLNGLKEGTATITAALEDHPGFSASLQVQIGPAPYEILWTLPIEGNWDDKVAYHCQAADGTLFIANHKKLKAVSNAGVLLWERDITDQYGFEPATPVVDDSNVYVYDSSKFNLALVALNQQDGSLRWSFNGGLGSVQQVRAGAGGVYLLTGGGRLYGLDRDSGSQLWQSPLSLGSGTVTLGLSGDGVLYYTRDNQVFRVAQDGGAGALYAAEAGAALTIKEIAPDGRIILEKTVGGAYSIVSVDPSGTKNWEAPVETAVELSCDAGGTVYAVTRTKGGVNPHVYFIKPDGTLQADRTITASRIVTPYQYQIYYKPLVGTDGLVYLPLARLYAVNAADGELLWQAEFKDGFFKRVAKTATLDKDNVVYLACDDAGFIALRSKVAGVADESGFYIDTSGLGSLRGNTYRNLSFSVRNDNAEQKEIRVVVALEEAGEGKVLNYAATADALAAGEVKPYNCGLYIPAGTHRVGIKLLDRDNQSLTGKLLPVS